MSKVVAFPKPYRTVVLQIAGKDVTLIQDVDAARITGTGIEEIANLLTPFTPVLYFDEAAVLKLRDQIKEATNVR